MYFWFSATKFRNNFPVRSQNVVNSVYGCLLGLRSVRRASAPGLPGIYPTSGLSVVHSFQTVRMTDLAPNFTFIV